MVYVPEVLPLSAAAMALHLSIRGDLGVLSTAAARYAPSLMKSFIQMGPQGALGATKLLRPFSEIVNSLELKDPFVRNWVDLLCFLLAGVKYDGTLASEIVYMFAEWYKPGCSLEYPLHGTGAVVDALVRGMQKFGGRLALGSHVQQIVLGNGRATGVRLKSGQDLPVVLKGKHDLKKKMSTSCLASELPEDCKFYPTKEKLHKFMWLFKEQHLSAPN